MALSDGPIGSLLQSLCICAIRAVNDSCRITAELNMSPEFSDYICAEDLDAANHVNLMCALYCFSSCVEQRHKLNFQLVQATMATTTFSLVTC